MTPHTVAAQLRIFTGFPAHSFWLLFSIYEIIAEILVVEILSVATIN